MYLKLLLLSFCVFLTACSQKHFLKLTVLDVGHADSLILESSDNEVILVDAGDANDHNILLKTLEAKSITTVDKLIISHPHENHYNQIPNLLDKVKFIETYVNGGSGDSIYQDIVNRLAAKTIKKGELIPSLTKNLKILVLNPEFLDGDPNENSLALFITYHQTKLLLLSDILVKQQHQLLQSFPFVKEADVIQVSHHGDFLVEDLIDEAKIYFASSGPNKWGAPNEPLLKRLKLLSRTDKHGSLEIISDGNKWEVQ